MRNRVIDPLELRRMVEAGTPYRQIAQHFSVSVGGVQQAVDRLGLSKKSLNHKKFVPWRVAKEHGQSGPVTALRNLSRYAQGVQIPLTKLNTGLRWATRLFEEELDIDYDRERGFFEKPADKDNWHIRMVLEDVKKASQELHQ